MSDILETKLRRLDFSLLLIFQETYRRRRATAAAQRLGLSQPAVSHALARLRAITGDPLFLRSSAGLQPTRRAIELAPKIDAILALAHDAMDDRTSFDPMVSDRLFRVSANDFVGSLLAAPLISFLAGAAPAARLSISFAGGPDLAFRKLRENDLDVAIGRFPVVPDDCQAMRLFEEDYLVVARADHPQIRRGLDLDTYIGLKHLIVSFAGDLVGTIDESLKRVGLSRRVAASSPMFLGAFAAAAESDLIVTAPRRLAVRFAGNFGLQALELPFPAAPFAINLVRSRVSHGDGAIDWLVESMIPLLE